MAASIGPGGIEIATFDFNVTPYMTLQSDRVELKYVQLKRLANACAASIGPGGIEIHHQSCAN